MSYPHDLLTLSDAAALVGRSTSTIRDWIRAGHLDRYPPRPGDRYQRVMVSRGALLARVAELEAATPLTPPPVPADATHGPPRLTGEEPSHRAELEALRVTVAELHGQLSEATARREAAEAMSRRDRELVDRVEGDRARDRETWARTLAESDRAHAAHAEAIDAERRRASDALDLARSTRAELEAVRAELAGARAELEAVRGRPWWRALLPG